MKLQAGIAALGGAGIVALPLVVVAGALSGWSIVLIVTFIVACAVSAGALAALATNRLIVRSDKLHEIHETIAEELDEKAKELSQAGLRYLQLMSATNDSIIVVDLDGKITEANATIGDLLGYDHRELTGHFLPDLAPATQRQSVRDFISTVANEGAAATKDLMLNQLTGEASWFDGSGIRIEEGGRASVQVILQDITASKRQFILTEKEISFIHELSRTLPLLQDFDQMLDRILSMLSDALDFEGFALVLAEPNDTIATVCVGPEAKTSFVTAVKASVNETLADFADVGEAPEIDFNLEYREGLEAVGADVGSQIMLPLAVVNGLAGLFSSRENAFKKEDLSLFSTMVSGISSLYMAYKSYQQVQFLSVTDSLTSLYNRRKFFEELQREVERVSRYGSPLTVVMLDIDHFKLVNDNFGHQMGDEVLRELAEILRENTRMTDVVARYGGEEFIIMLTETPLKGAMGVAGRIKRATEERVILGGAEEIKITVSIGVGSFEQGDTVDTLIGRADKGLYRAKDNGRNRIELVEV